MVEGRILADRYRLDSLIGEGGLACVYRATDLALERTIAVKILRDNYAKDAEAVARFRSEARAAAGLNHPNIVQIFDTGADGELYYIVMEYLPEPDLKRILEQYAPLPSRKVIEVVAQCCRALSCAHQAGLVHRDVKPHNILFTEDGIAKLSDFGIAAAAGHDSLSLDGMVLGSAHYVSPEQAQGKPVGPQSDIYSLGCVMYEALTGQTPFQGETAAQIAAMHVEQRPVSPHIINPNITPSEEFVVNKAIAKDPARRYQSAEEVLDDLGKLAAGEELDRTGVLQPSREAMLPLYATTAPETPTAEGRPAAAPTVVRSQPLNVWSIVAAVLIALIVLVFGTWLIKLAFYPGTPARTMQVPGVKGYTEAEARERLSEVGLQVGSVAFERTDTAEEGTVITQSPPAGTMVAEDTEVDLVIARGEEIVPVVSVVGLPLAQAEQRLAQAGLTLGTTTEKFSREPEGTVIAQSIQPATRVEEGTAIDVDLSKGPEEVAEEVEPDEDELGPEEPELPVSPNVHVEPDPSYRPADRELARWIVRVTPQGQELGQKIDIWYTDQGGRVIAWEGELDPGTVKEVPILGRGSTTIEVRRDDEVVFEDTFGPPGQNPVTP